jgi:outer membrane protein OmpA-like peptidoglycan-associated protein
VGANGGTALTSPYSPGGIVDVTLFAQWTQDPPPPSGGGSTGGGSTGGGSTPAPSNSSIEVKVPGIVWAPLNMVEGDALGDSQLNATFSIPGSSIYSYSRGFKPDSGSLQITVTFTPDDKTNYMVLSTTRTIEVTAKPKATPTPTPTISVTPMASPKPIISPKPKTVVVTQMEKIGTIYFKNNEYFLDARDRTELKEISQHINNANFKTVIIQGNTDIKQGVDNVWLSKARAEAVSNYLSGLASAPFYNRVWYASRRPVAIGIDKVSLALNRRVEIYAQVTMEKPASIGSIEPKQTISKTFDDISFNRNEAFLDASDRKSLLNIVRLMAKSGCTQVFLKGSHDRTKSAINEHIGNNRANAVRKFMAGLLPSLTFRMEPEFVSAERVVEIRCTN